MVVELAPAEVLASVCPIDSSEPELAAHAVDGLIPRAVVRPRTVEEVAAVVRLASEHRWALAPWGGGTFISLGGPPRALDVVVDMSGLDQVLEYEPADMTCTVQAGVRLGELQRRLAQHGQFLALDPPEPDRVTVGGLIASNVSGPLRLRYGTCRDLLIGVKVVGTGGQVTRGGGRVVKNVTGYDMCKLYTGSLGTLGIIVEASFKLWPLPRVESTVVATYPTLEKAYATARALHRRALPLLACGLISPTVSESRGYQLAAWIGGSEAAVERLNRDVSDLCSAGYAPKTKRSIEVLSGAAVKDFWRGVEDFGRQKFDSVAKLSTLPSRTGELLARLPEHAAVISHVLSGVTYVYGVDGRELAPLANELGGYLVLEKCSLELKREMSVWGPTGDDFKLMARIKEQFDPAGIFNPGRYVGGL